MTKYFDGSYSGYAEYYAIEETQIETLPNGYKIARKYRIRESNARFGLLGPEKVVEDGYLNLSRLVESKNLAKKFSS